MTIYEYNYEMCGQIDSSTAYGNQYVYVNIRIFIYLFILA